MSGVGQMYPWQTDPGGFLQSILGLQPKITSTFRTPAQNEAAGGVPNSEHLTGNAIDFTGPNMPDLATRAAQSGVPFDQLINEGNHIHMGFRPGAERNQTFGMNGAPSPPQVTQSQMVGAQSDDPVDAMLAHRSTQPEGAPPSDPIDMMLMHQANQPNVSQKQSPFPAPQTGILSDVVRSALTGTAEGGAMLAGIPGDLGAAVHGVGDWAINQIPGGSDFLKWRGQNAVQSPIPQLPTSSQVNEGLSSAVGGYHVPQTVPGKYAETIASFLPAAAGGPQSLGRRLLGRVVAPGAVSEGAGELTQGTSLEPYARVGGAILGGSPALVGSGLRALGRALSSQLPQDTASLVADYERLGGNLRPGQYNPSRLMRAGDTVMADLPFSGLAGFKPNDLTKIATGSQADQYNGLLAKTFGENATRLTDDVLQRAQGRIGDTMDKVLSRNTVSEDEPLLQSFVGIHDQIDNAAEALDAADVARLRATTDKLSKLASAPNGLSGSLYQNFRQRGGLLDGLAGDSNPTVAKIGVNLKTALDDAFQRQAPEADAAELLGARQQYRALKTIEPLAAKAPGGDLSGVGASLLARVTNEYGLASNAGDLGTIARVGKQFVVPSKSSGTAENAFFYDLLKHPLKAAERGAAGAVGIPLMGTVGRMVNATINSPEARRKALAQALLSGVQ